MLKIELWNIIFTVVNLFVLFFIIWKFLFKPVRKIIAKRQEEIDQEFNEAKQAKEEAENLKTQYEESMKSVNDECAGILREARNQAGIEYDKIVGDAEGAAEEIIEKARKNAEEERRQTLKQTKEEIADIVTEATAKLTTVKEDPDADRRLFDDFIAKSGDAK